MSVITRVTDRCGRWMVVPLLVLVLSLISCYRPEGKGPWEAVYDEIFILVTENETAGGVYVQVTFRTFAFEIARLYYEAEEHGWDEAQIKDKIKRVVETFAGSSYPAEDGTEINNIYYQYLIYVNPSFDILNPIHMSHFENFRRHYVQQVIDKIYDIKNNVLRNHYDERWGYTQYSRLIFSVRLENRGADNPSIAGIGDRTFLVDDRGNRYRPSGLAGPYPYSFDSPRLDVLESSDDYRVFFPNRKADRTPIIMEDTKFIKLVINDLGGIPEREFRWDLPLVYPESPRGKGRGAKGES